MNGYNVMSIVVPATAEFAFPSSTQTISLANPAPVVTVKAELVKVPESPVLELHEPVMAVGDGKEETAVGLPAWVVS